jgi:creatinine amidohydrolase
MAGSEAPIRDLLQQSLSRLRDFGVRAAVLFTGHFSDEQLELIDDIAERWTTTNTSMRVLSLAVNRAEAHIAPDHAGVFETTLLSAMWADRVQLQRLPSMQQAPSNDPDGDVMGNHRHNPSHFLYGVFGPDPRMFEPKKQGNCLTKSSLGPSTRLTALFRAEHTLSPTDTSADRP